MPIATQLALLMAQGAIAISLVLFLFRLRVVLGRTPLFVAIGAFQYMQVVLAASLYIEVLPGVVVSPGSAVLFMATLAAVLLVYIEMDAVETRKLIYGLVAANVTIAVLSYLYAHHVGSALTLNLFDLPRAFFFQSLRIMVAGSLVLLLDAVLVILVFEWISRRVRWLFPRLALTLVTIAVFDSLLFVLLGLWGHEGLFEILRSAIIGKSAFGLLFATALWLYVTRIEPVETWSGDTETVNLSDVFQFLTYRQKYESAREEAIRDGLTGLYNRRYFEEALKLEIERAKREKAPLTLMVLDLDGFKKINDRYGHPVGDRVIQVTAGVLENRIRASDVACRIGGEEFAVVLPRASIQGAEEIAIRLAPELSRQCQESVPEIVEHVSATVGLASHPADGDTAEALFSSADRRLYEGKRAGGARVIASGA